MMTKFCIFCGSNLSKKKSSEHIFPKWIQEKYELSDDVLLQTHFSEKGEVLSDRHHVLDKHVLGRVCNGCNNGWMSNLEGDAKPIIINLADSNIQLKDIDCDGRLTLAKWACKTAFAIHAASNYRDVIPSNHYKHLSSGNSGLPVGVWVFAFQHKCTQSFAWWQSTRWYVEAEETNLTDEFMSKLRTSAYRISFSIRDLALIVVHNPFPFMQLLLLKGVHFPLYPERGPVYWYERNGFPNNDTHGACVGLMAAMGLRQKE